MRAFIPPSLTDTDDDWHGVATTCSALSTQLGSQAFCFTFTMTPYWHEYRALTRDRWTFADSAIMMTVFKTKLRGLCSAFSLPRLSERFEDFDGESNISSTFSTVTFDLGVTLIRWAFSQSTQFDVQGATGCRIQKIDRFRSPTSVVQSL
jgi:hypothetical protein